MESSGVTTIPPNGWLALNAKILEGLGAGDGTRTRDVQLGKMPDDHVEATMGR